MRHKTKNDLSAVAVVIGIVKYTLTNLKLNKVLCRFIV